MNRIFKITFSGLAVIFLFLTVSQAGMAEEAVPPLPMTVKGVASIDGSPAPNGTVVAAYLNGQPAGKFLVNTSSGDYCFWISGTAGDEGKPVTFTINGMETGSSIAWESGKQILSLELSTGKGADPKSSIKRLSSEISLESLKEIGKTEVFGENSRAKVIESSVPQPNLKALKDMEVNSADEEATESSRGTSKLTGAPDIFCIYAVAGIILLAFGWNFRGELRKKR
jgi:hypothetical protein